MTNYTKFGYSKYEIPNETRNFFALRSPDDNLSLLNVDSTGHSTLLPRSRFNSYYSFQKNSIIEFCQTVKSVPVTAPDYRKLEWNGQAPMQPEKLQSMSKHMSNFTNDSKPMATYSEVTVYTDSLPLLEDRYRIENTAVFKIQPNACNMVDQAAAIAQNRALVNLLGSNVILLNDPIYFSWLRGHIGKIMDKEEEERCAGRTECEALRAAKIERSNVAEMDKIFATFDFPKVCDKILNTSRKQSLNKMPLKPRIKLPPIYFNDDEGDNTSLDDVTQRMKTVIISPPHKPETLVIGEETKKTQLSPLKMPKLRKDNLSELNDFAELFKSADKFVTIPEEITKYTIKIL